MRYVLSAFLVAFLGVPAAAQPIHWAIPGQPAAYDSQHPCPTDDFQGHWMPAEQTFLVQGLDPILINVPGNFNEHTIAHVHLLMQFCRYAEFGAPFVVPFTVKLFHFAGHASQVWGGQVTDVFWDATGSSTPPDLTGDPHGLRTWTGHVTFDPAFGPYPVLQTDHGWFTPRLTVRGTLDNGDIVEVEGLESAYSIVDRTAPETPNPGEGHIVSARVTANTTRGGLSRYGTAFGSAVSEYVDFLPVGPIQAPWATRIFPYNYSPSVIDLPLGNFEQRMDLDLHNNVPGTLLARAELNGNANFQSIPFTFDPAVIGSGDHRFGLFWNQSDGVGNRVSALLAVGVSVGPGVPLPTLCADPTATNVGGLLPCVFPTPPVDVCPNLQGVQTTVPVGLILVDGQCVIPPVVPVSTVYTFTCDLAGKCTVVIK